MVKWSSRSGIQTSMWAKIRLKFWSFVLLLEQKGCSLDTRKSMIMFTMRGFLGGQLSLCGSDRRADPCQAPQDPEPKCWGGRALRRENLPDGPNHLS